MSRSGWALLAALRALRPDGALSVAEALRVAEAQAAAFTAESGVVHPPVPGQIVTDLPFVTVRAWKRLPVRALTARGGRGWEIVLRAEDSLPEQRLSLLHEFKHIIDAPDIERWHFAGDPSSRSKIELACRRFAAAVLMPEAWLRRDWAAGRCDIAALAERYRVPRHAVESRLQALGLEETEHATRSDTRRGR